MRSSVVVRPVWACAMTVVVVSSCGSAPPVESTPTVQPRPSAVSVKADPRVGAVFLGDGGLHVCTGAVLASRDGDLILTAAHCLADGVIARFSARFGDSTASQETGTIDAVYLDPRWLREQNPLADYAIARVRLTGRRTLQAVAGGGLRVGGAPVAGTEVTVTGYAAGVGGAQTSCTAPIVAPQQGFPTVECDGIVGGFSGAPWISGSTVTGVVGGLNGGGCRDEVSYSPPFDDAVAGLLARAEAGGPSDAAPTMFDDGCE